MRIKRRPDKNQCTQVPPVAACVRPVWKLKSQRRLYSTAVHSMLNDHRFAVGTFLRRRRAIIGYAVLGALLFVAFLAASFPYGDTLTSILAPYKLKVVYQSQHMSAPIGAALINVRLISTADPSGQALVQSSEVRLAPTIGSLFFGRPGLNVRADL